MLKVAVSGLLATGALAEVIELAMNPNLLSDRVCEWSEIVRGEIAGPATGTCYEPPEGGWYTEEYCKTLCERDADCQSIDFLWDGVNSKCCMNYCKMDDGEGCDKQVESTSWRYAEMTGPCHDPWKYVHGPNQRCTNTGDPGRTLVNRPSCQRNAEAAGKKFFSWYPRVNDGRCFIHDSCDTRVPNDVNNDDFIWKAYSRDGDDCTGSQNLLATRKKARIVQTENRRMNLPRKPLTDPSDLEASTCECYGLCKADNADFYQLNFKKGNARCKCITGKMKKLKNVKNDPKKHNSYGWISDKGKVQLEKTMNKLG